ncbi:transporter substrate-binding domain-containing protein [Oxalobacteraceae bacterium]|nr:transporter substrate-binding domain-containing protein [Oxalobacteraceae bacterium]
MKVVRCISMAGIVWTSLCAAQAGEPLRLRVMAQESLPPKWLLRNGQPDGLCPDILEAIEKIEPRLEFSGQEDLRSVLMIEQGLESGGVSCACALLDTEKRRKIATVVGKPLYMVRQRIAAAAGDKVVIDSLDDLVKLKPLITTSRGAGYAEQLRTLGLEVDDSTGDNLTNLKKIIGGHGRFFYMNELTLSWIVRDNALNDKVRILPEVLKEDPIYFWISKKADPQAVRLVDRALNKLKANGELLRIYERWNKDR